MVVMVNREVGRNGDEDDDGVDERAVMMVMG